MKVSTKEFVTELVMRAQAIHVEGISNNTRLIEEIRKKGDLDEGQTAYVRSLEIRIEKSKARIARCQEALADIRES